MTEDRTTTGAPPEQDGAADGAEQPAPARPAPAAADADADRTQALSPVDGSRGSRPGPGSDSTSGAHAAPADGPTSRTTPLGTPAAAAAPATVLPPGGSRPARPAPPRVDRGPAEPRAPRSQSRPAGRRRARLVVQRVDAWSVFLFSLVASICLGVVLLVAVAALYAALSSLGVLGSLNGVLGEVAGSGTGDEVVEPFITSGRVLGATAVLAAIDVVLLTALATLGALLYNLCASLTGGVEVQLGERD